MASSVKRGSLMEETIEVKPSIELIADEYEHFERSKRGIILHTFASDVSEDKHNEELFLKTISKYGYQISAENRHSLDQDNLGKIIVDIIGKCRKDDAGIILFFSGPVNKLGYLDTSKIENNMNIQDIWLPFNSHNCLPLKNKPKIFIFDLSIPQPPIQTDGTRRINNQISSYDTPAEADILIIYNKTEEYDDNYMEHFCENIKEYAETENIITLASCTGALTTPIIISTLTKKFYLADSELRGHHFIIDKHHREINNHVQDIKVALGKTGTEKTKKLGFFQSIRERMSKDSDSSKNTSTKNSTTSVNSTSTNTSTVTDNKAPATAAPARRPSGPSVPRNRGLSESDTGRQSARRLSENRRPPWRN